MQRALVLDPATGDFRAHAEQLQDKAGKLDARPRTVANTPPSSRPNGFPEQQGRGRARRSPGPGPSQKTV
ncbi:hypothetical protein ACE1SV_57910 [Streptomyces sennicomposti]